MKKNEVSPLPIDFYLNLFPKKKSYHTMVKIIDMIKETTGKPPVVWNDEIFGVGEYEYIQNTQKGEEKGKLYAFGCKIAKHDIIIFTMYNTSCYEDLLPDNGMFFKLGYSFTIRKLDNMEKVVDTVRQVLVRTLSMHEQNKGKYAEHNKSLTKKKRIIS